MAPAVTDPVLGRPVAQPVVPAVRVNLDSAAAVLADADPQQFYHVADRFTELGEQLRGTADGLRNQLRRLEQFWQGAGFAAASAMVEQGLRHIDALAGMLEVEREQRIWERLGDALGTVRQKVFDAQDYHKMLRRMQVEYPNWAADPNVQAQIQRIRSGHDEESQRLIDQLSAMYEQLGGQALDYGSQVTAHLAEAPIARGDTGAAAHSEAADPSWARVELQSAGELRTPTNPVVAAQATPTAPGVNATPGVLTGLATAAPLALGVRDQRRQQSRGAVREKHRVSPENSAAAPPSTPETRSAGVSDLHPATSAAEAIADDRGVIGGESRRAAGDNTNTSNPGDTAAAGGAPMMPPLMSPVGGSDLQDRDRHTMTTEDPVVWSTVAPGGVVGRPAK
ncbi:hypothetical protein [Saccharopolyspora thermophila]|uniref:WXG100 family type VII secretion target n=1 Tax=Saccharopolyspora thermophila TaxID=89367 RepID=A0ABP3M634_9PSEU